MNTSTPTYAAISKTGLKPSYNRPLNVNCAQRFSQVYATRPIVRESSAHSSVPSSISSSPLLLPDHSPTTTELTIPTSEADSPPFSKPLSSINTPKQLPPPASKAPSVKFPRPVPQKKTIPLQCEPSPITWSAREFRDRVGTSLVSVPLGSPHLLRITIKTHMTGAVSVPIKAIVAQYAASTMHNPAAVRKLVSMIVKNAIAEVNTKKSCRSWACLAYQLAVALEKLGEDVRQDFVRQLEGNLLARFDAAWKASFVRFPAVWL